MLSIASLQIPSLEHNDCVRVEMACNQMRQAISLVHPEVPLVKSGYEAAYTHYSSSLVRAIDDGCCYHDKPGSGVWIAGYNNGGLEVINTQWQSYLDFDKTLIPRVPHYRPFKKGDILACTRNIHPCTGELMLGKNLLVGFLSAGGWNYEDAIVISQSAANKMAYQRVFSGRLELEDEVLFSLCGDDDYIPILEDGTKVNVGDPLFKISTPMPDNISAVVPCHKTITAEQSGYFYSKIYIRKESVCHTQMSRWLKAKKKSQIIAEKELLDTFSKIEGSEEKLTPYLYTSNSGRIESKTAVIDFWIVDEQPLTVGCKLANRHGNKGVISIIKPDEEMPMLKDGRRLEVILNSLGVISRMNLGQLFELHINYLADMLVRKNEKVSDLELVKKCLTLIEKLDGTPNKEYSRQASEFALQNVGDIAYDIRTNGLQIIQPPFSSASFDMIMDAANYVGEPLEATIMLDGKEQKCSVGKMYMLRLQHEPDHKIFGRSVGAYGKHEQAPSGTDAHRMGEMEVWCLFAYEAWGVIREFHSIKADNPEERYRFFQHLYDQKEEFYEPLSLQTVTYETFRTYLKGAGLKVTF